MPEGHRIAGVGVSSSVKKLKKNIQVPSEAAAIVNGSRSANIVKIAHSLVPSLTGALDISSTPLLGWDLCELIISYMLEGVHMSPSNRNVNFNVRII